MVCHRGKSLPTISAIEPILSIAAYLSVSDRRPRSTHVESICVKTNVSPNQSLLCSSHTGEYLCQNSLYCESGPFLPYSVNTHFVLALPANATCSLFWPSVPEQLVMQVRALCVLPSLQVFCVDPLCHHKQYRESEPFVPYSL